MNRFLRPGKTVFHWTQDLWELGTPECTLFLRHPMHGAEISRSGRDGEIGREAPIFFQLSAGEREQLPAFEGDSPTSLPTCYLLKGASRLPPTHSSLGAAKRERKKAPDWLGCPFTPD